MGGKPRKPPEPLDPPELTREEVQRAALARPTRPLTAEEAEQVRRDLPEKTRAAIERARAAFGAREWPRTMQPTREERAHYHLGKRIAALEERVKELARLTDRFRPTGPIR